MLSAVIEYDIISLNIACIENNVHVLMGRHEISYLFFYCYPTHMCKGGLIICCCSHIGNQEKNSPHNIAPKDLITQLAEHHTRVVKVCV